jgi:hypothetical protein
MIRVAALMTCGGVLLSYREELMDSVRERAITFSSANVAAIREDRKTQTRRSVKDEDRVRIILPRLVRGESFISPAICAPAGIYKPQLNRHGAVSIFLPSGLFGVKQVNLSG